MITHHMFRLLHTSSLLREDVSKALLAKLRKKTGYAFSNCKKALEVNGNDVVKAEIWLNQQAKTLGWEQSKKVQSRSAAQGLIALKIQNNRGVLVEINCETDFVAKNQKFQGLVGTVASSIYNHVPPINSARTIEKVSLSTDLIKNITASDGDTLADHTAMMIGIIKENIVLKRALCMTIAPELKIFGDVHPLCEQQDDILYGKYGALLVSKSTGDFIFPGREVCKHIIGMNPTKIGDPIVDKPKLNKEDEQCLIYQEFLMEPKMNVEEILGETSTEILDYVRFELGEEYQENRGNLETVEVCG